MGKRSYCRWGVSIGLAILLTLTVVIMGQIALSYDGRCGGLIPFLAGPRPCSFWEFFAGMTQLTLVIVWRVYWPWILMLVGGPAIAGYLLDRRKTL